MIYVSEQVKLKNELNVSGSLDEVSSFNEDTICLMNSNESVQSTNTQKIYIHSA